MNHPLLSSLFSSFVFRCTTLAYCLVAAFMFSMTEASAQAIRPRGNFQKGSMKIGEEVTFGFKYVHPIEEKVLFPDSTYDFSPFEFVGRNYTPTQSDSTHSFDSVTYILTSFELEDSLSLSLPVFILSGDKKIEVKSLAAKIAMDRLITTPPDSVTLIANNDFQEVPYGFDYTLWGGIGGGVAILAIVIVIVFGKRIQLFFKARAMQKKYEKCMLDMDKLINAGPDVQSIEESVVLWKSYLTGLTKKPIASYTTKEVHAIYPDDKLWEALKTADRAIYAHANPDDIKPHLIYLKDFASKVYHETIDGLKA